MSTLSPCTWSCHICIVCLGFMLKLYHILCMVHIYHILCMVHIYHILYMEVIFWTSLGLIVSGIRVTAIYLVPLNIKLFFKLDIITTKKGFLRLDNLVPYIVFMYWRTKTTRGAVYLLLRPNCQLSGNLGYRNSYCFY